MEYKLKTPIVLGDETIESLELVEPTQARLEEYDFDYAELTKAKGRRKLLCACVKNASEAHIMKMKPMEITKAADICAGFFD
jgi:hypothetical protein